MVCGLQAKTTYWPGLDQAGIVPPNRCLVGKNCLAKAVCLVGLDSALLSIDQHEAKLLQRVKSQERSVCEFNWEFCIWVWADTFPGSWVAKLLYSGTFMMFIFLYQCCTETAANADCGASFPTHTFPAWDKGHDRAHIYQLLIYNLW